MPFQSEKQRRYLHANHPEIAQRWENEYATGGISNHFRKKFKKGSYSRSYNPGAGGVVQHGPVKTHHGGGGGGGGPPSIVHAPKGPTAAEIAAAKAAAAAKKKAEAEAKHKNWLHQKAKEKKKKVSWFDKLNPFPKSLDEFGTEKIYTEAFEAPHAYTMDMTPLPPQLQKPLDYSKGQGNISNIRHAVGTSIAKDAISDYLTQSVPMDKWYSKPVKKVADWTGGIGAWTHGLGQEIKDATSAIKKGHLPTQSVEDVIANTLGLTLDKGTTWSKADEIADYYATSESPVNKFLQSLSEGQSYGLTQTDLKKQLGYMAEGGIANDFKFKDGGILDITGKEEITTDDGNDIELTAYNAEFDDPNDLSTGVKTLFRAKDGGTPQLAKKSKDGTRPGYRGSDWGPGAGSPGTTSAGDNKNTGGGHPHGGVASQYSSPKASAPTTVSIGPSLHGGPSVKETLKNLAEKQHEEAVNTEFEGTVELPYALDLHGITPSKTQRMTIHSRNVNVKKQNYEKALAEQRKKMKNMGLLKLVGPALAIVFGVPPKAALKGLTVTPKDLLTVIKHGRPVEAAKKEYLEALEMSNRVILSDIDINNPSEMRSIEETTDFVENMNAIKDLTPEPTDPEDTKGDGPAVPEVVPVHEEIEEYEGTYAMSPWDRIKANQAKRAMLVEKGIIEENPIVDESVTDITMQANKGGLANLFRVKNQ